MIITDRNRIISNSEFTFDPIENSRRDKIMGTVRGDKANDDSEGYKLNKGYSSRYEIKNDLIKDLVYRDYKYNRVIYA